MIVRPCVAPAVCEAEPVITNFVASFASNVTVAVLVNDDAPPEPVSSVAESVASPAINPAVRVAV